MTQQAKSTPGAGSAILEALARIEAKVDALAAKPAAPPTSAGVAAVATDADLDSKWGDGEIKRDPPRWDGPSYAGRRMSECPPEYLDVLASFNDWRAEKDIAAGKDAKWPRTDAARARGWADRIRAGHVAPAAERGAGDDAEEIPF